MKTAILLFILAFALRVAAIAYWHFDGLYGQDAFAYFDQAVAIAKNLPQGQPPPTDFFWPNGYPALIAAFMLLVGQSAWAGQLAALLCGSALAPLAYLLSLDLWCDDVAPQNLRAETQWAGILAGLIIAVAGQPMLSSIVVMADMPALLWAALAVWLVVRTTPAQTRLSKTTSASIFDSSLRNSVSQHNWVSKLSLDTSQIRAGARPCPYSAFLFLGAGATLGLAIISRWLYLLLIPVLGLYLLFKVREKKVAWWQPWPAVLSGSVVLTPQLWLSLNKPAGLFHSWLLGWNLTNLFRREFENIDGHFYYQLPNALFYAQPAGHPAYVFPLLGLAGLWGLWRLGQTRQWGPLILLLGWMLSGYLFLAGIPYQNFRFGLTHYLPWVLLSGFGLSDLLSTVIKGQRDKGAEGQVEIFSSAPLLLRSPAIFKVVIILSLAAMLAWAYPMLNNFLRSQNQSKLIAQQVEQIVPADATLITFGLTLTVQHYTQLNTTELFFLDAASLQTLTKTRRPLYLLLDVINVETQWQGKVPQANYRWLKTHLQLIQIRSFPPYTLFEIKPP